MVWAGRAGYAVLLLALLYAAAVVLFSNLESTWVEKYDELRHAVNAYEMVINDDYLVNTYFGETDVTVNKRVKAALASGLTVILCVGEYLEQREQGVTGEVVAMQTKIDLQGVSAEELKRVIIAYEPVWAIGTGKTATAAQANEVCALIRATVAGLYSQADADALTIQYGGSMNAKNAEELLDQPDVDGGLIGGASLKPADFAAIVKAASR